MAREVSGGEQNVSLQERLDPQPGGSMEEGLTPTSSGASSGGGNPMKDVLDIPWADHPVFVVDFLVVSAMGVLMGLLSIPYSWITDEPEKWLFEQTGPEHFLETPETMQFRSGAPVWILMCWGGGTAVGILKALLGLDTYPSFITELKHQHVEPLVSLKVLICCIASLATGATLGLEAGLGATGSALGFLVYQLVDPVLTVSPDSSDIRRRCYILCGIAAGFGAILPAPYVAAVLVAEVASAGTERDSPQGEFLAGRKLPKKVLCFLVPAATFSFVARWAIKPEQLVEHPGYLLPYDNWSAVWAIGIGIFAAFIGLLFLLIQGVCKALATKLGKIIEQRAGRTVRVITLCSLAGAVTGLGMYLFPLVYSSGRSTMKPTIQYGACKNHECALGIWLLIGTAVAKSITFSMGMACGLVGGLFFPAMYVGLLGGEIAAHLFNLDPSLTIPIMLAAVPGSFMTAPLTMLSLPIGMFVMGPLHSVSVLMGLVTANTLLVGTGFLQKLLKV